MRIGILGGTFNPPHLAHLVLAECARDALGLDRVLLVPAARPPHKAVDGEPGAEERLELCRLAADGEPALEVADLELRRDGPSYTADTLAALAEERPGAELVLLLGGDAAAALPTWHRPDDVVAHAAIGVAERGEDGHAHVRAALARLGAEDRLRPFEMPALAISSTLVRARIRAGRTIHHLVPRPVEQRIVARGLYRVAGTP